jgi:hypothetical protein
LIDNRKRKNIYVIPEEYALTKVIVSLNYISYYLYCIRSKKELQLINFRKIKDMKNYQISQINKSVHIKKKKHIHL